MKKDEYGLFPLFVDLTEKQAVVIDKPTFGSVELGEYVRKLDREEAVEEILLIGVCTDICVVSNAVLARTAQPEAEIVVDAACTASNDPALNEAVLQVLAGLQVTVLHHGS